MPIRKEFSLVYFHMHRFVENLSAVAVERLEINFKTSKSNSTFEYFAP